MKIVEQKLGCALIEPTIIRDNRGWFQIPFSIQDIHKLGLQFNSVFKINHSMTMVKGIVRGPNYQRSPYNQAKIVRVIKGSAYSVGIDIDPASNSFGMAVGYLLSERNKYLMYISNTYAHGFTVLEDGTELEYMTDNEYSFDDAKSIWLLDEHIIDVNTGRQIDWSYSREVVLSDIKSEKNANAPMLKDAELFRSPT